MRRISWGSCWEIEVPDHEDRGEGAVTGAEARPGSRALRFSSDDQAIAFLRRQLAEPQARAALRSLPLHSFVSADLTRWSDGDVVRRLAHAIVRGEVRLVELGLHAGGGGPAPPQPEPPVEEEAPPEPLLSWIEFRLVDEATGSPVSGVRLKVRLPDGASREFAADGGGRIRIDDINPGSCDIESMTDDRVLEVVDVSPA